ncbi:hypothetical protein BU100_02335 [Staphylococcus xylosus]|nr:hypothetical protein BE24_06330 [Staphylococcus xylosus]ARD74804.1 hypothetical protein AWC37_06510 [Staphylococcus xylosus]KTW23864.1 hypothetical protein NS341_02100 [Staphylococcus xylosus]OEL06695.1 hypothetical protein AST13_01255 [Staphylococcus xylosus]PHS81704.1 hypothetical protein BTM19_00615 [Staphylococcus xylosus]
MNKITIIKLKSKVVIAKNKHQFLDILIEIDAYLFHEIFNDFVACLLFEVSKCIKVYRLENHTIS